MIFDQGRSFHRCQKYEVRDFRITFPDYHNLLFTPEIHYRQDGAETVFPMLMTISDWSRLFKAEGIDPETPPDNEIHFVKTALVLRGYCIAIPDEDDFGTATVYWFAFKDERNEHINSALVKLSAEDVALVCRFKGKEALRIAGDGTTPESRQQLVAALREMLIHLPPEDGAKIVEQGMVVTFDAPDLAKLIETELAIKVVSNTQGKQHQ